jgi:hypothetical protein
VKYRVVDWDPSSATGLRTPESEAERILNENAANGWELDRLEDLEDGQRRFYFKTAEWGDLPKEE